MLLYLLTCLRSRILYSLPSIILFFPSFFTSPCPFLLSTIHPSFVSSCLLYYLPSFLSCFISLCHSTFFSTFHFALFLFLRACALILHAFLSSPLSPPSFLLSSAYPQFFPITLVMKMYSG